MGSNKIEKTNNIVGFEKVHLKGDCINESILGGVREHMLYSFALGEFPGQKKT